MNISNTIGLNSRRCQILQFLPRNGRNEIQMVHIVNGSLKILPNSVQILVRGCAKINRWHFWYWITIRMQLTDEEKKSDFSLKLIKKQ